MKSITRTQLKLTELLDCFSMVDSLVNCHVANFFTKNLWDTILPGEVRNDLNSLQLSKVPAMYLKYLSGYTCPELLNCPHFLSFLEKGNTLSIRNNATCLTPKTDLKAKLIELGGEFKVAPIIKNFMSEKKTHEVMEVVPVADVLACLSSTNHIVDIGGGKGYLSTTLASHSQVQILGIDSSAVATDGAVKMEKKIKKQKREKTESCVREVMHVSSKTPLAPLLEKHFGEGIKAGMLGLHTCGNLASTCCRIFVRENVPWIINVACCYHLIDEEFDTHPFWSDFDLTQEEEYGFPVSQFLKEKKIRLGRNARMLAAHSLERLTRDGINEKSAESLLYRAILQVVIESSRGHSLVEGQVGKLYEKTGNFREYVRKGIEKLDLNIEISDKEIDDLFARYQEEEAKLRIFFLLRTHFAPLVESVILLDRLLFLFEQGIEDAHLVALFKPELSPRNHAIIAWKKESWSQAKKEVQSSKSLSTFSRSGESGPIPETGGHRWSRRLLTQQQHSQEWNGEPYLRGPHTHAEDVRLNKKSIFNK